MKRPDIDADLGLAPHFSAPGALAAPAAGWLDRLRGRARQLPVHEGDLRAAWVSALVMIPQAVAFAVVSGLSPEAGLMASVWPVIVAALLGASRLVLTGPNTAVSLMLASALLPLAAPSSPHYAGLAALLTLTVGLLQLLASRCGVGRWLARLPDFVSIGLSAGIGIVMISSQLSAALGLLPVVDMSPWRSVQYALVLLGSINPYAAAASLAALLAGALATRLRIAMLPPLVFTMVGGSLVALLLGLAVGPETVNLEQIGYLRVDLLGFTLPTANGGEAYVFKQLIASAVAIAVVGGLQTILISRSLGPAECTPGASARDLLGQGAANVVASFTGGLAVSGSFNRTAAHVRAGAQTRLAAVLSALLLLLLACLGGQMFGHVALPAVAATIMLIGWGMVRSALPALRSMPGHARCSTLAIIAAVAVLGIEGALLFAAVLGYISLVRAAPPSNPTCAPQASADRP